MPILYSDNLFTNTTQITGSLSISGSFYITSSTSVTISITGSTAGTSSYANNSATASFITSSNVVGSVLTASYSLTSSNFNKALYSRLLKYSEATTAYRAMGSDILFETVGYSFINASTGAVRTMTSGTAYGSMILVTHPTTLTGVYWIQGVGGAYTAANYNGVGLYKLTGTSTYTLVASSSNDGNTWKFTSATQGSASFSAQYSAGVGIYMALAVYNSSAQTSQPAVIACRKTTANGAQSSVYFGSNTFLEVSISRTSTTTLPSSITSTVTAANPVPYFALY